MALIAMFSAKGSPGTTGTALALALTWDRPVILIEADTAGSSSILSGYLRGSIPYRTGLLDLAVAHRSGGLLDALYTLSMPIGSSSARLIPGPPKPPTQGQARYLAEMWGPLGDAAASLDQAGTDVIVDLGRVGPGAAQGALLASADQVLVVTRTTLPAIAAAHAVAPAIRDELEGSGNAEAVQLLLVGEGHPYSTAEIAKFVPIPVAAVLAWDPVNAEVFSVGATPSRKFEQSSLIRSTRAAAAAIGHSIAGRRQRLTPSPNVLETIVQESRTHAR